MYRDLAVSRSNAASSPNKYTEELPGIPDGEYVAIVYKTKFERKKNGTEIVSAMKYEDGK